MKAVRLPGLSDYAEVHALQQRLVAQRAAGEIDDVVLLLEHAEVITVGRQRGAAANVVEAGNVPVVRVERGGDVTWHGPGQLVAYPIVGLQGARKDLHRHLRSLEEAVMRLLVAKGLQPQRDDRNTGVWLPPAVTETGTLPRKVCAVGIACRKWVTWHGLALNVHPDPAAFARIRPCGFEPDTVTRVSDHLAHPPSLQELVAPLARELAHTLQLPFDGEIRASL
ncbi:MAG: lipoyl(octanoyl) transferase LipB [Myxococcales bacterium]|nr:lipoyl(octanoyl) transferase LipB [Myxococcales bacterium]